VFTQCDVDIVGSKSMAADAECLLLADEAFKKLKIKALFEINNRKLLDGMLEDIGVAEEKWITVILIIDKMKKISREQLEKELEEQGVLVDALVDAVNREVDLFDIVCHVAYDQPPLTRKERANNVKKRNYFTKYGDKTKKVLEALLDKYADEGISNLENIEVLKVNPFDKIGSVVEIIESFGSKEKYLNAIKELEQEIYRAA